jgi:hypothetical protein
VARHFRTKLGTPAAAYDEAFEHGPPADDPDFFVVDLNLIEHGPDIGAKGVSPVRTLVRVTSTNFAMFSCVIRASG